jgi:hypothetical protein
MSDTGLLVRLPVSFVSPAATRSATCALVSPLCCRWVSTHPPRRQAVRFHPGIRATAKATCGAHGGSKRGAHGGTKRGAHGDEAAPPLVTTFGHDHVCFVPVRLAKIRDK